MVPALHIIGNSSTKENAVRLYNFIKEFNKEHGLPVDQVFLEHKTSNNVWWVHFGLNVDDGGKHMRNYYGGKLWRFLASECDEIL